MVSRGGLAARAHGWWMRGGFKCLTDLQHLCIRQKLRVHTHTHTHTAYFCIYAYFCKSKREALLAQSHQYD